MCFYDVCMRLPALLDNIQAHKQTAESRPHMEESWQATPVMEGYLSMLWSEIRRKPMRLVCIHNKPLHSPSIGLRVLGHRVVPGAVECVQLRDGPPGIIGAPPCATGLQLLMGGGGGGTLSTGNLSFRLVPLQIVGPPSDSACRHSYRSDRV